MASPSSCIATQESRQTPQVQSPPVVRLESQQPRLFDIGEPPPRSKSRRPFKPFGGITIHWPDPRVKQLEQQLARCAAQVARLPALAAENNDLKQRMRRLRQLKSSAEEGLMTLKTRQKASAKIATMQIRDAERYASTCLQLYELSLTKLQQLIKAAHAGEKFVDHKCPGCGPKPIHDFGVRMLPSGQLGFNPYCLECTRVRKEQARRVVDMDVKEVAAEFVQRTPKVARQMVDRFEEEVEDLMEQEASKNSSKS